MAGLIARLVALLWCAPACCSMSLPPLVASHAVKAVQSARGEGLAQYITRIAPTEPPPEHIRRHLIPALERARWIPSRIAISMPPRHAKSKTVCRGLAWMLDHHPTLTHGMVTHSNLWKQQSEEVRDATEAGGRVLRRDKSALNRWKLAEGGGMWAAGLQGSISGRPVTGWLVTDDGIDGVDEADSVVQMEAVTGRYLSKVFTRLQDRASEIVIGTRWGLHDLIGRLLAQDDHGFQVINLAASSNARGEPCSPTDAGAQALWDAKFPLERLERIRRTLGEYLWMAMYQGAPIPKGGRLFNQPAFFDLEAFRLDGHRIVIGADPAATEGNRGDHSVALVMAVKGYGVETQCWILDVVRLRCTVPEFARRLVQMQSSGSRWAMAQVAVEAVGGFKAVPQTMRDIAPDLDFATRLEDGDDTEASLREITPTSSKFIRVQPFAAAWNDRRVFVPGGENAPTWVAPLLRELGRVTGVGDKEDDQMDAGSLAFNALYSEEPPSEAGDREQSNA
jgi:phage terminase large subunit-like protein